MYDFSSLAVEICKVSNAVSTSSVKDIFLINKSLYALRHNSQFYIPLLKTMYSGTESISNLVPKMWDMVPRSLNEIGAQPTFQCSINVVSTLWINVGITLVRR